jgi:hypothetical protein
MVSLCAGETMLGHVMMWVLIIVLMGLCFMGHMAEGKIRSSLHKGKAAPHCTHGICNPVNFTILKPSEWPWGHIIGIRRDGKGLDPGSVMHLKLVTVTHESSSYQVFYSFYEEMRNEFSISAKA